MKSTKVEIIGNGKTYVLPCKPNFIRWNKTKVDSFYNDVVAHLIEEGYTQCETTGNGEYYAKETFSIHFDDKVSFDKFMDCYNKCKGWKFANDDIRHYEVNLNFCDDKGNICSLINASLCETIESDGMFDINFYPRYIIDNKIEWVYKNDK